MAAPHSFGSSWWLQVTTANSAAVWGWRRAVSCNLTVRTDTTFPNRVDEGQQVIGGRHRRWFRKGKSKDFPAAGNC